MATCKICRKAFESQRVTAKFCSDKCRKRNQVREKNLDKSYVEIRRHIQRMKDCAKRDDLHGDAIQMLRELKQHISDALYAFGDKEEHERRELLSKNK